MKTILFLHGFFASGSCELANALKSGLEDKVRVLTPDLRRRLLTLCMTSATRKSLICW